MASHALAEIGGHAGEVVHRQHEPRVGAPRDVAPCGGELHVDVLGPQRRGTGEDREPFFLRPVEPPAFPPRAARDDHRPPAARQRAGDVEVGDPVQAELDEIADGGVARRAEVGHRGPGDGFDQLCHRSTPGSMQRLAFSRARRGRSDDRPLQGNPASKTKGLVRGS